MSNKWKELESEIIEGRSDASRDYTQNSLNANTGFIKFMADMIQLFFPGMVKAVLGAKEEKK